MGPEVKLLSSCLRFWFSGLTKRKFPIKYIINTEVFVDKKQKIKHVFHWAIQEKIQTGGFMP